MMTSNNITKKDLNRMAVNQGSLGMEFSWNYERQIAYRICYDDESHLEKNLIKMIMMVM